MNMAGNNRMDLKYEERASRVEKVVKNKNYNSLSKKLVKEDDTLSMDSYKMMLHGMELNSREGNGHFAYSDNDMFIKEVDAYMKYTDEKRMTPTMLSFSLWMGVHSTTIMTWREDSTHPMHQIIKNVSEYFHNYLQQKALDGELNPLMYFFLSKNYFGMKDKTEIVHRSQNTQVIDLSDQQRILNAAPGIVIDVEYDEKDIDVPTSDETKKDELDYDRLETLLKGARNEPQRGDDIGKVPEKFQESSEKFQKSSGKVPEKFQNFSENNLKCNQKATDYVIENDVGRENIDMMLWGDDL